MRPYANFIQEYYHVICSGEVIVGKLIRRLYEKIIAGLRDGVYHYDGKTACKAVEFIESFCHHCEGQSDLIRLELWQKALISCLFGVMDENGDRQFREAVVIMGRKNGKSLLASAIECYMAYMDGEYGAKIYNLAPKLEQAAIVYENTWKMVQREPELSVLAQKRRSDVYLEETNTSIKPLAFNAKKSDGFNPQLTVCDEIASWPAEQGKKQYDVMKSALGARRQPLILSISTAGYINDGVYDDLITRGTSWLMGSSKERRLLPVIYQIDDREKWNDLTELQKSNPNMGVSVREEYFLDEIAIAENSLSKKAEFMTKYCNIKQSSTAAWLPYEVVDCASGDSYSLEDFRSSYCVGGIDLSQTTDLTSCCVVIEKAGKLYTFSQFFMPANKIMELQEREGVPYDIFVARGWLKPSGENFVDYHDCFDWFVSLVTEYEILPLQIGYDRYSAQYLVQDLNGAGFHTDDVFQGWNLSPVMKETEGLLRDGVLRLGDNSLLKSHFLNVAAKLTTENNKIQPVKIEPRLHIDGFVAVIDALTVRQKWYDQIGEQLKNNE